MITKSYIPNKKTFSFSLGDCKQTYFVDLFLIYLHVYKKSDVILWTVRSYLLHAEQHISTITK